MTDPFGAFSPSPFQQRMRAMAHRLKPTYWGRRTASLLLGPAGGRARRAYDVEIFGSQKARLHPYDNICEKRVYLTPQLWDDEERALLREAIARSRGGTFAFVDVGANVGLYTLFARAEALRVNAALRGVAIEADPEMAARLQFNLAASHALHDITLFNCAASDEEKALRFTVNKKSRGLSRVDKAGALTVNARPLHALTAAAGLDRIDAMKIDIEGHEYKTLDAFFKNAPATLHPAMIILEVSHEAEGASGAALAIKAGYRQRLQTKRNAVFTLKNPMTVD